MGLVYVKLSGELVVACGVPQGSLLFVIYINDLPNCLTKSINGMYADDKIISIASSSLFGYITICCGAGVA